MVNYQKSKIYKIVSTNGNKIYVDSTTKEYLSQRFQQHKNDYKRWKDGKMKYQIVFEMFETYNVNSCKIILIETFPCNTKDEKTARTQHHKTSAGDIEVGYVMSEEDTIDEYGPSTRITNGLVDAHH
jgi:hypothetical protein